MVAILLVVHHALPLLPLLLPYLQPAGWTRVAERAVLSLDTTTRIRVEEGTRSAVSGCVLHGTNAEYAKLVREA